MPGKAPAPSLVQRIAALRASKNKDAPAASVRASAVSTSRLRPAGGQPHKRPKCSQPAAEPEDDNVWQQKAAVGDQLSRVGACDAAGLKQSIPRLQPTKFYGVSQARPVAALSGTDARHVYREFTQQARACSLRAGCNHGGADHHDVSRPHRAKQCMSEWASQPEPFRERSRTAAGEEQCKVTQTSLVQVKHHSQSPRYIRAEQKPAVYRAELSTRD